MKNKNLIIKLDTDIAFKLWKCIEYKLNYMPQW